MRFFRPLAISQVMPSEAIVLLNGLIIRRSWVRSPPAPLFEFPHVKCVFMGRHMGVTVTSLRRRPLGVPMVGGLLMTVCCWQAHLPFTFARLRSCH